MSEAEKQKRTTYSIHLSQVDTPVIKKSRLPVKSVITF